MISKESITFDLEIEPKGWFYLIKMGRISRDIGCNNLFLKFKWFEYIIYYIWYNLAIDTSMLDVGISGSRDHYEYRNGKL